MSMERYLPPLSETGARWARFLGLLAVLAVLFWLMERLSGVLTPLVIALALAYIFNPLVTWLERYRVRRIFSISLLYVLGVSVLFVAAMFLIPAAVVQLQKLAHSIPQYIQKWREWLGRTQPDLLNRLGDQDQITALVSEHGTTVANSLLAFSKQLLGSAAHWGLDLILIPLYLFFFLRYFNQIVAVIHDHLPAAYRAVIVHIVKTIDRATADFFRGRLIVCIVVGILGSVGWSWAGVPYSLPLGILLGALSLIPALSVLALPPALLFSYLKASDTNNSWFWPVIWVFLVYMGIVLIETVVLHPTILAHSSGLHPVTVIVALLIGAELGGVLGLLLAIPLASTLKSLAAVFILPEIRRLARAPVVEPGAPPTGGIVSPEPFSPPAAAPEDRRFRQD